MSRPLSEPDVYRAIADPTRRAVLDLLAGRQRTVGEMADRFAMTLPAFSRHLKVLRATHLVKERRDGPRRVYRLNPGPLREVAHWVGFYEQFWRRKLKALGQHLEETR